MVQSISSSLPEENRIKLFEETGRALAKANDLNPSQNLDADIQKSLKAVNSLGAMAELIEKDKNPYISCHSCPVGTLVHTDPLVCRLVAAYFSEVTGQEVSVKCQHEETLVCGFSFDKS